MHIYIYIYIYEDSLLCISELAYLVVYMIDYITFLIEPHECRMDSPLTIYRLPYAILGILPPRSHI